MHSENPAWRYFVPVVPSSPKPRRSIARMIRPSVHMVSRGPPFSEADAFPLSGAYSTAGNGCRAFVLGRNSSDGKGISPGLCRITFSIRQFFRTNVLITFTRGEFRSVRKPMSFFTRSRLSALAVSVQAFSLEEANSLARSRLKSETVFSSLKNSTTFPLVVTHRFFSGCVFRSGSVIGRSSPFSHRHIQRAAASRLGLLKPCLSLNEKKPTEFSAPRSLKMLFASWNVSRAEAMGK